VNVGHDPVAEGSFVGPDPGVAGPVAPSLEAPPSCGAPAPEPDEVDPPELEPAPDEVGELGPPEPLELPFPPEDPPELSLPPDEPLELAAPSSDDGSPTMDEELLPPHAASAAAQATATHRVESVCASRRMFGFIALSRLPRDAYPLS
jgi:hypothetical protein